MMQRGSAQAPHQACAGKLAPSLLLIVCGVEFRLRVDFELRVSLYRGDVCLLGVRCHVFSSSQGEAM